MKVKLEITAVEPVASFGESGKKVAFTANGKPHVCYKPTLFAHIQEGKTIEGDVEEKETQRGLERRLTGIEGVGSGQGGGRSYGKSPETVQYERASIEFNNAMSETGLCVREGKAPQDIEDAYWGHLRRLLSRQPNAPQSAPAGQGGANFHADKDGYRIVIPSGIPQPRTVLDDAEDMDNAFAGTVDTRLSFTTKGDFYTAAYKAWGLGPSEIGAILTTADMQDLNKAWEKLERNRKGQGGI